MTEYPQSSSAQRTVLSYDGNGNVVGVKTGCSASDTYSTCTKPASIYSYDDFGNVLSAAVTGASSGAVLFEVDASGNVIKKRTPAMPAGAWLRSIYDAGGRMTELDSLASSVSTLLYRMAYDDGGVAAPSGCGADLSATASLTLGRVRYRQDSFGYTWLRYDAAGRVLDEIRSRDGTCGGNANNVPATHYSYNANGDLSSIVYPYGRTASYVYGAGAAASRVASVAVTYSNGTAWLPATTILSNVTWEPYGGLRSYQAAAGSGRLVEYVLGDNATSPGCPSGQPTANDATGRLRGLWVSSVGGSSAGDIMKLTYTWQADQIGATDTCLLGSTTPRTETFTYDGTLRLTGAGRPAGNVAATGGAFSSRVYGYDGRGNRTSYSAESIPLTATYDASRVDQLISVTNPATGKIYGYSLTYDADGRVTSNSGTGTSYAYGPDAGGANDTVFKSVSVQGGSYNYFYDALNQRRYKSYPTGVSDEYFYDLQHQLLVDQGNSSLSPSSSVRMTDEYIWLGGRAVAIVRGSLTSAWTHQADNTGTCARNGDQANCGIYFPITDVIDKAVLMLNAAGKVVGTGEYDPFGHVNRVFIDAETAHPYDPKNLAVIVFADATQPPLASPVPTSTQFRALFQTAGLQYFCDSFVQPPRCRYSASLRLADGDSNTTLWSTSTGGSHLWSSWVQPSNGRIK